MLSEIYFLRLEAAKRAADDTSRAENARYVPLAPSTVPEKAMKGAAPSDRTLPNQFRTRI